MKYMITAVFSLIVGLLSANPMLVEMKVLNEYPHDPAAFTQGFEFHNGWLYESIGRYGRSGIRYSDPISGSVYKIKPNDPNLFGEGLTVFDNKIYQITWREKTCIVYNAETFEVIKTFSYLGEGWGLTNNGEELIMSDGTAMLTFRDPDTFEVKRKVEVKFGKNPMPLLNELEYVDGFIYANVFEKHFIVKIVPETGEIVQIISADSLRPVDTTNPNNVLNGIAYNPDTKTFWVTGKLWDKTYEVTWEGATPPVEEALDAESKPVEDPALDLGTE